MKTGHPKTLTLDQNALRKVLDDMKPDLDDERVLRRLTLNRNNSNMNQKNFARTDHSPMTDRTHYRDENKPIMRDARFDHEYDAYNQNYPVKDLSSSLYAENEQLKKENKTLKLKEQKYLSQISSLEREKKSLVALLEQSEQNLQDSIKKSKQESKRMNAVIESFRRSLQCTQQQNSKEDKAIQAESPKKKYYVKDNFSFQATASPQRQTEQNNYSMVVIEQLADLSMKVKTLECHAQELVKENGRLINEVESLKAYNSRLEQYIQTNRPVLEGLLEEKRVRGSSSNVEAENALYKLFVRDLATNDSVKTLEEQSAFTNSAGYSGGKYAKVPRHSSGKPIEKPQKTIRQLQIPSYLKAISLSCCIENSC